MDGSVGKRNVFEHGEQGDSLGHKVGIRIIDSKNDKNYFGLI